MNTTPLANLLAMILFALAPLTPGSPPASASPASASPASPSACHTWTQVNDGGFGIGVGDFASEEGFEVIVHNDRLYVGMEGDNSLGARLWRTKDNVTAPANQADWEEVIADGAGLPWGVSNLAQVDHIDSLASFNGVLFASSANRSGVTPAGSRLFRSTTGDPGTWEDALSGIGAGFGNPANENFKDMQVFGNWLCGGTANLTNGAQVWCTESGTGNGSDWAQKNVDGFGEGNVGIYSGQVFGGALYFGARGTGATSADGDDVARLYRTPDVSGTSPTWTKVFEAAAGTVRVDILGELDGFLYISHVSSTGMVILRSATGDLDSWTQVNIPGMDGNKANAGTIVDGGTPFDGHLYVGVYNSTTGVEVWRTDGAQIPNSTLLRWEQVGGSGLGNRNTLYAELIPFNGSLYAWTSNYVTGQEVRRLTPEAACPTAKYVILMIADGWGYQPMDAANRYTNSTPAYQGWDTYAMSTFPLGGSYNPGSAASTFYYVQSGYTDSAAAATALYTGIKTANGRISVDSSGAHRLYAITEKARLQAKAVGAVTTVQISHATPGAWEAHNDARGNGYPIANEGLWGDPSATSTGTGAHGDTLPPLDVVIGGGHPNWNTSYVNSAITARLASEEGTSGAFAFVERGGGTGDGGSRLLAAANDNSVTRLAGLFGGSGGNIEYRLADGSGHNPDNPTLAQMTQAALAVLERDYQGFTLLVEGGAVDWAAHDNNLDQTIGEMIGFNQAVQAVIDWVDDPATPATWDNTLVIVTGDHETGHLTAGPGIFPSIALTATINAATLAKEKPISGSSRRASWDDANNNSQIDAGETVYWYWHSGSHVNSVIPLFARGAGAGLFARYATGEDSARGAYVDNTDVFKIMDAVLPMPPSRILLPSISANSGDITLSWPAVTTDVAGQPLTPTGYEVHRSTAPYFRPTAATRIATASTLTHTDVNPGNGPFFYMVIPILGTNRIGPASPTLGVITFSLTPGE